MAPSTPRHTCGWPIPRRAPGSRRALRQRNEVAINAARAATTSPWLSNARQAAMARRTPGRDATVSRGEAVSQSLARRPVTSLGISLPAASGGTQDLRIRAGRSERDRARSVASMAGCSDDSGSDAEQAKEQEDIAGSTPSTGLGSRLRNRTYITALSETPDQMSRYSLAAGTPHSELSDERRSRLSRRSWGLEQLDEVPPPPSAGQVARQKPRQRGLMAELAARRHICNLKATCHCCIAFAPDDAETRDAELEENQRLVAKEAPLLNPRTRQLFEEIGAAGRFPHRGAHSSARFVGLSTAAAPERSEKVSEDTGKNFNRDSPFAVERPKGWSDLIDESEGDRDSTSAEGGNEQEPDTSQADQGGQRSSTTPEATSSEQPPAPRSSSGVSQWLIP
mmetsp:Transcript_67279/g.122751  ORF Transcript_67279/g.122751 Transcript_67279/m.122751 type:complete len:395 (-) Transcript_67279:7-1191(-)